MSIVVIGILAWGTYALFMASYAAAITYLTAIVVLLVGLITTTPSAQPMTALSTHSSAAPLALAAYAAWPTRSAGRASAALGDLITKQHRYLRAVLDRITGNGTIDGRLLWRG